MLLHMRSRFGDVMAKKCIKRNDVVKMVAMSSATIYRLEKEGLFPSRRRVGKRAVVWFESEILDWLESREESLNKGKK